MPNSKIITDVSRRRFLKQTALVIPASLLFQPSVSMAKVAEKRSLRFHHTHTNEKLAVDYFSHGRYLPDSLHKINHLLRDFRTEEKVVMDADLSDVLFKVQQKLGSNGAFEIISGYRSPKTNNQLRKRSNGVAKRSLHMLGKAIDVRLTDRDSHLLKQVAIDLKKGGVGYYAESDFVHLDTGNVRNW